MASLLLTGNRQEMLSKSIGLAVIIPTYNRASILKETLDSFVHLSADELQWEIIVVDNNSTDTTKDVVNSFKDKIPVKYLFEPRQGKNFALNSAISIANGEILVFTDDDVLPAKNWLLEVVSSVKRFPEGKIFGGKIRPQFPKNTPDWITNSYYSSFVFGVHDPKQDEGIYQKNGTPGGGNCWIRSDVFELGHMYDVSIGPQKNSRISGSELEFFTRMSEQGIKPIYIPSAIVIHRIQEFQTTKKYLLKRSFASGRGFTYIKPDTVAPRLFGVPRFLYRQVVEYTMQAIYFYLLKDIKKSFENAMTVAHRLGCIKQYKTFACDRVKE